MRIGQGFDVHAFCEGDNVIIGGVSIPHSHGLKAHSDGDVLLHALADGKVSAAGLDVLPDEPSIREEAELIRSFFDKKHDLETLFANHVLQHMRNVIVTPHSAFNTKEAVERILTTTGENIVGFIEGEPRNLVNKL